MNRIPRVGVLKPWYALLFLKDPIPSITVPIGHIHPQKKRPRITVKTHMMIQKAIPGKIRRLLIDVIMTMKGSILKNASVGRLPVNGYVVDQSMYTNSRRKIIWDVLRTMTHGFMVWY